MKKLGVIAAMLITSGMAYAEEPKPAFTGQNYSGVYDCKGSNDKVGEYEVTISLKINRVSSYAKFGAYTYEMTTVNSATYIGQAIANGNQMALSFPLKSGLNVDHSIGIAKIVKNKKGRWSFRKHYYEEDNSGGNYGSEYCVLNIDKPFKDQVKEAAKEKEPGKKAPAKEQTKEQSKEQPKVKDAANEPVRKEPAKKQPAKPANEAAEKP
jgi:hypothetical protein